MRVEQHSGPSKEEVGQFSIWAADEPNGEETEIASAYTRTSALKIANGLSRDPTSPFVYVYEFSQFVYRKKVKQDYLLVWWNEKAAEEVIGNSPDLLDSGTGLYYLKSGSVKQISYDPVPLDESDAPDSVEQRDDEDGRSLQLPVSKSVPSSLPMAQPSSIVQQKQDNREYKQVYCDDCGVSMPQYEANKYAYEKRVGRTSGSYRRSSGSSSTVSNSGRYSSSTRSGSSYSGGRAQFRTVELLLCDDCYKERLDNDYKRFIFNLKMLGVIAILIVILFIANSS